MLMNSVNETTPAPMMASVCARSESGETRSFSRNWRRNSFVSCSHAAIVFERMSGPQRGKIREITSQLFRVVANHQLREHAFERAALQERPQPLDGIVGDDIALVKYQNAIADFFDDLENV